MDFFSTTGLIDTHCHLNDTSFDEDREKVVERAIQAGVERIVDIGIDLESSERALENSEKYKNIVFPGAGIDMEMFVPGSDLFKEEVFSKSQIEIGKWINESMEKLDRLLATGKFVMVGECGMDFYWLSKNEKISEEDKKKSKLMQKLLFPSQIELAIKYKLPLSIHSRGAEDECIEIIKIFKEQVFKGKDSKNFTGSFHSFTGTVEQAKKIAGLGFKIGINGIITYKKAENIREIVRAVGRENLVFETDAPFLVPLGFQPLKKGRNEPASVAVTRKFVESLS
ncbi:TatD family hydrolase [Candidatus Dojkabacteria bacterium]|nr:TatD family hydrolase [Candidatus Dojkabacteria bacterium]